MTRAEAWREVARRFADRDPRAAFLCNEFLRVLPHTTTYPIRWFAPDKGCLAFWKPQWSAGEVTREHRVTVALLCADIIEAGDA